MGLTRGEENLRIYGTCFQSSDYTMPLQLLLPVLLYYSALSNCFLSIFHGAAHAQILAPSPPQCQVSIMGICFDVLIRLTLGISTVLFIAEVAVASKPGGPGGHWPPHFFVMQYQMKTT